MELTNSHCHTQNSDGKLTVLEVAELARANGLTNLCITDHHIPIEQIPADTEGKFSLKFPDYFNEIRKVNQQPETQVRLFKGVELDWISGYEKWFELQTQQPFDFVLGAVHSVSEQRLYAPRLPISLMRTLTREYFNQIRRLASSGFADSIAHLDLIKFAYNETSPYYQEQVLQTLETIAKSQTAIEINTSGKRKGSTEFHPSSWILRKAFELGIPLTIGTDCHYKEQIAKGLIEAYGLAKSVGYKSILRFEKRKPIEIPLDFSIN